MASLVRPIVYRVSDALEILSSGFVRFDGLLLRLDRRARVVSCFVRLCKTEAPGKVYLSYKLSVLGIKSDMHSVWKPGTLWCGCLARLCNGNEYI
jgi:hypothetical protein